MMNIITWAILIYRRSSGIEGRVVGLSDGGAMHIAQSFEQFINARMAKTTKT